MTLTRALKITLPALAILPLAACMAPGRAVDALPAKADIQTAALAQTKDGLSTLAQDRKSVSPAIMTMTTAKPAAFTGRGFSQVRTQPGKTMNEKRLMAIRAARMEALRDLTEQVHGIRIDAETTVRDQVVRSDHVRGLVEGEIRGARTVQISPKDGDSFEVVMELSPDTVRYLLRAVRMGV